MIRDQALEDISCNNDRGQNQKRGLCKQYLTFAQKLTLTLNIIPTVTNMKVTRLLAGRIFLVGNAMCRILKLMQNE